MCFCPDWNTLIVGKLSPWIDADSDIDTERRNSEAVSPSNSDTFFDVLKKASLWSEVFLARLNLPCPVSAVSPSKSVSLYHPVMLSSCFSFPPCFSPGSGTGVKLLRLSGSARLHDASKGPSLCQPRPSAAEPHPHWTPHLKCKTRH